MSSERCVLASEDLSGPTPCTYSPPGRALQETNSPAYTMGYRRVEIRECMIAL